jgi:hypothetical protein
LAVVGGGMTISRLDATPAFQRREHHEKQNTPLRRTVSRTRLGWIGVRVSTINGLEVSSRPHAETVKIAWLLVGFHHDFHGGYEADAGLRRDIAVCGAGRQMPNRALLQRRSQKMGGRG